MEIINTNPHHGKSMYQKKVESRDLKDHPYRFHKYKQPVMEPQKPSMMNMHMFTNLKELMEFAENIIDHRIKSLIKDVNHCLQGDAAFPAFLYCFSTIDLLGALHGGNAVGNTTNQSLTYMQRFMKYSEEQSDLLQKIFRHKIVHLAQPTVINYKGHRIGWSYSHAINNKHLDCVKLQRGTTVSILPTWKSQIDYQFTVSILQLVADIQDSVECPDGYLTALRNSKDLQMHFANAIEQIYDPK